MSDAAEHPQSCHPATARAPLPVAVTPDDLARLNAAHARMQRAEDHAAREREVLDLVNEVLRERYRLGPDDAIAEGGRIVRALEVLDEA